MKIRPYILFILVLFPCVSPAEPTSPKPDPKRIINESNGFLKDREPDTTAEEHAIYEKVVPMLSTQPEFALKLLEAMVNEKEKPSPAFECILGNAYYSAGQNTKAETNYRNAVTRYPTFLRAWSNLGVLYYSQEKFSKAITCLSKAIGLGDRDPTTYGLLGFCLEKEGNPVSAEIAFMQAITGDPSNTNWIEGLLRISLQSKMYARAEILAKSLIKDHRQEVRYWLALASVLLSNNRKLEAIALLEQTVVTGLADQEVLAVLGDLYAEQKLIPEAIAIYQKTLALTPVMGERKLLQLSQILIADRKWKQALSVLDVIAPKLSPEGRIIYLQARADIFSAQKKWPDAKNELGELLKLAPLNGAALLSLGHILSTEDDIPHATLAFEAAYQIPESTYRACIELANIELKNHHVEKSISYLEKALSIERSAGLEDYLSQIKCLLPKEKLPTT